MSFLLCKTHKSIPESLLLSHRDLLKEEGNGQGQSAILSWYYINCNNLQTDRFSLQMQSICYQQKIHNPIHVRICRSMQHSVSFPLRNGGRCCGAFPFARRSSRGRLGNTVTDFILPDTAVKGICRHIHSPHKVPACDALGSPFLIELPEPRPVGGDRLSPGVLALSLSDIDALTLSLFELLTLQLRQGGKNRQNELASRCIGVDIFFVADEGNTLISEYVDDVQQVLCRAS